MKKTILAGLTSADFAYAALFADPRSPNRAARRMAASPRFWRKVRARTMEPARRY